jgi:hypothetical protein
VQAILEAVLAPLFERLAPMRRAGPRERRMARRPSMLAAYGRRHPRRITGGGASPWRRAWAVCPGLLRRLVR